MSIELGELVIGDDALVASLGDDERVELVARKGRPVRAVGGRSVRGVRSGSARGLSSNASVASNAQYSGKGIGELLELVAASTLAPADVHGHGLDAVGLEQARQAMR